jgi:hypothetical protein
VPDDPPGGDCDLWTLRNIHPGHNNRVSAGFILFRNTDGARGFLNLWRSKNRFAEKDHPALTQALKATDAKVGDMTGWLKRHEINRYMPDRGLYAG